MRRQIRADTHTHTHIHTHTRDNYSNPRCTHACRELITASRKNNKEIYRKTTQIPTTNTVHGLREKERKHENFNDTSVSTRTLPQFQQEHCFNFNKNTASISTTTLPQFQQGHCLNFNNEGWDVRGEEGRKGGREKGRSEEG